MSWETVEIPFSHSCRWWLRAGPAPDAPLVVLCHGMGEDPATWAERWPQLGALPVHLVVPSAPYPYEIRRDGEMRIGHAWYLYDGNEEPFRTTLMRSAAWLVSELDALETQRGWRPRERALVGYSQGAYFGFVAALRAQRRFSRLVAVAGRLKEAFVEEPLARPGPLATLILHGEKDRSVPADTAERSRAALAGAGYAVDLEILPRGHGLHPDRDARAAEWLERAWFTTGRTEPEAPPA